MALDRKFDIMPITLGIVAVPSTAAGTITTFTWTDNGLSGPGYTRTYNATGGSGTGARFTVTRSTTLGITSVTLNAGGTGYKVGDNLSVTETSSPFDTIAIVVTATV